MSCVLGQTPTVCNDPTCDTRRLNCPWPVERTDKEPHVCGECDLCRMVDWKSGYCACEVDPDDPRDISRHVEAYGPGRAVCNYPDKEAVIRALEAKRDGISGQIERLLTVNAAGGAR